MVKRHHKIFSVVLCLAMIVCAMMVVATNASAATGDTIYVKVDNDWNASTMYCYMWKGNGGSGNENASWPGKAMTLVDSTNKIYSYKLTDNYEKVIFNTGNGGSQTTDLTYTGNGGDGKIYSLKDKTWTQYVAPTTSATQATAATQGTQATVPSGSGTTVYFKNTANWTTVNCYMWNSTSDSNASWPGKAMTHVGDDVWMYTANKTFANCIFNNGSAQTGDLSAKNGYIYDYSANSWEIYDTSTLQVKSYSAEPASSVYAGMEVMLSATAASPEGAVSYKFSVKNAAGTTTYDSGFSLSNSAAWTPAVADTYTVTFDFKDTAGNTNSRSTQVSVADDSTLTKPIIKKVTPSDSSYVKTGTSATIDVTAGGGNTGTNLLFYKYVIVDPNGEQNTAYYTLNDTYHFTPTSEGAYKVTVYVQASDNSEARKTFTVNATGGNIPTDPPTTAAPQPTTQAPQPTTQAPQPTTQAPQPTTQAPQPTTQVPPQPTTQEPQPTTQVTYQPGDVNKDGVISIQDATYLQRFLAEYDGVEVTLELGDVNGNGRITIKDVTAIQKIVAEMI